MIQGRGCLCTIEEVQNSLCEYTQNANDKMGHVLPVWQVKLSSALDGIKTAVESIGSYLLQHPIDVGITGQGRLTAQRPIIISIGANWIVDMEASTLMGVDD